MNMSVNRTGLQAKQETALCVSADVVTLSSGNCNGNGSHSRCFFMLTQLVKTTQKLYWLYCQRCGVRTDHVLTVYGRVKVYTCQTPGCSQVKEYVTK